MDTHRVVLACKCGRELICPEEADHEIAEVNDLLREYGFEYPLGARGVHDALRMLRRLQKGIA